MKAVTPPLVLKFTKSSGSKNLIGGSTPRIGQLHVRPSSLVYLAQ